MPEDGRPGGPGQIGAHAVARIGYGAMSVGQGPAEGAIELLRRAAELGVNHLDTASFYDDGEVNRRIRLALNSYPREVVIVSKVGAVSTPGRTPPLALAQKPEDLRAAVERDLEQLAIEHVPVVNLRRADIGPGVIAEGDQVVDLDDQLAEMIALRDEGKIGEIGLSNVDAATLTRALPAGVVCVQNAYSLLDRRREDVLQVCLNHGVAWVPFFPLGSAFPGFPKVADDPVVQRVAADVGATPAQVGLAWLLAHAPNTLLIPGTRSVDHLEDNLAAGTLSLSAEHLAQLDAVPGADLAGRDGVEAFRTADE
ncbi:aldo/keto reductase [Mycobacterium hodleri]|uniref:aldo/keto reductase n=1 Tax=Mycolicibacterium hodleri TaxID=49897 RepID=UPI0021F2CEEC|nr:aldo/keto reductase [Mycolicibacterium hodleri]MCV7133953.1 aldo/keto reductase [Mycolicibacterium hodleri]